MAKLEGRPRLARESIRSSTAQECFLESRYVRFPLSSLSREVGSIGCP